MVKAVAIIGTHGVGKTTLAYQLCSYLKERLFNVKLIHETARCCPFPLNEDATEESELFILHSHFLEELKAVAEGYEAYVADRSPIDPFVYFKKPAAHFYELERVALKWMEKYDLVLLVEPNEEKDTFIVDSKRSPSVEFRNYIKDQFRLYVRKLSPAVQKRLVTVNSDDIFRDFKLTRALEGIVGRLKLEDRFADMAPV
ncbi:MAG: AAA family ATPase [Parachlamydiales bacterium]|jgi:nicotinamide riboside kinase